MASDCFIHLWRRPVRRAAPARQQCLVRQQRKGADIVIKRAGKAQPLPYFMESWTENPERNNAVEAISCELTECEIVTEPAKPASHFPDDATFAYAESIGGELGSYSDEAQLCGIRVLGSSRGWCAAICRVDGSAHRT